MSDVSEISKEGIDKVGDVVVAGLTSTQPLAFISFILIVLIFFLIFIISLGGYLFIKGINENNELMKDQNGMLLEYRNEVSKFEQQDLKHLSEIENLLSTYLQKSKAGKKSHLSESD